MGPQGNIFEDDTGPEPFCLCLRKGRSTSEKAVRMQILSCYEKVKGEISLFRDIVDLLQVLSMFLCFFDSFLLSVGIGDVGRCW